MPVVAPIFAFETNASKRGKAGRLVQPGKLKPADKREGGPAPAQIERALDKALRGAGDPLIGTSLGLLFMTGEITAPELAAGAAF